MEDRVKETNSKAVRGLIHPNSLTHISIQKSSETPRDVVPSKTKYIAATGKQALMFSAALIPVPMMQEAIGVALKIIQMCEVRKISAQERLRDGSQPIVVRMYPSSSKRRKTCEIGYAI